MNKVFLVLEKYINFINLKKEEYVYRNYRSDR